jgi:hypothetical protein
VRVSGGLLAVREGTGTRASAPGVARVSRKANTQRLGVPRPRPGRVLGCRQLSHGSSTLPLSHLLLHSLSLHPLTCSSTLSLSLSLSPAPHLSLSHPLTCSSAVARPRAAATFSATASSLSASALRSTCSVGRAVSRKRRMELSVSRQLVKHHRGGTSSWRVCNPAQPRPRGDAAVCVMASLCYQLRVSAQSGQAN